MAIHPARILYCFTGIFPSAFSLSSIGSLWLTSWGYGESEPERVPPELLAEKDFTDPSKAVSRNLLYAVMTWLLDYRIAGHVHDEVVLEEVPVDTSLHTVCEIMGRTLPWLPGIELRADGFEAQFYQK